ncbi:hypothetical protein DRP05_09000 [Archaeoglobales archaeon]|nr:MAG: hypothetical protein DRP05_09000 [Archaeoglobales archaeon]
MENLTDSIASFVKRTKFEDLPKDIVHKTKLHIIDTIGAIFAGSETPLCILLKRYASNSEKLRESTIIASGLKTSSPTAALINGVAAHSLEIDDGHRYCGCHPGTVVIPAALAIGEKEGVSGKKLILAVCLGYGIMVRIGHAINPSHLSRGFHTTGTAGVFGASIAASKIMNLSKDEIRYAMGIAGIQSSGLLEVVNTGQMVKPLIPGKAAQSGVLSAMLSKDGIEGPVDILDGDKGFFRAMAENIRKEVFYDLGINFEIANAYFKFYTACRHIHPSIDAAKDLYQKYRELLNLGNLVKVIIKTYPVAVNLTGNISKPRNFDEAKFSLMYAVSQALLGKGVYENYEANSFEMDKNVLELCEKCEVISDPNEGKEYPKKRGSTIEVHLKNGKVLRSCVELPVGEPENPANDSMIIEKFKKCCYGKKENYEIERVVSVLLGLEKLKNVRELLELVR